MNSVALKQVAEIAAGYPFRGSIPEVENGSTCVIQMKDLNSNGGIAWDKVIRTNLEGKKAPALLLPGDLIFVSRGDRFFAECLSDLPGPAVCSPHFFWLRVKDAKKIIPEFLSWQINQQPAQRYFAQSAEGSSQQSIRRGVLEELPLTIPDLERQKKLVALATLARYEKIIFENMISNRERELQAIAQALLQPIFRKVDS